MDFHDRIPQVAPQPLCAVFEPLLPLLQLHELDATEEFALREHIAGCGWCQAQLAEYDDLRIALRQRYGDGQWVDLHFAVEDITPSDIMTDATTDGRVEPAPIMVASSSPVPFAPRRRRHQLAAFTAVAAVLLLALLAGEIFRLQGTPAGGTEVPGLGTLQRFQLPRTGSQPRAIVASRDGSLWFTENDRIGRITPQGDVTEFPLPAGMILNGLAAGPDGNIWFTEGAGQRGEIGRLNPRDGKVTEFPLPTRGMIPILIVAGSDGNLWFGAGRYNELTTGTQQAEIGRITPAGTITEFPLAGSVPPDGLTAGLDGNLWFTGVSSSGNVIGRITPAGTITWFSDPSIFYCNCGLSMITAGPDGNLWYISAVHTGTPGVFRGQIGRITPQGVIIEFPLPGDPSTEPNAGAAHELAPGPDGNIWFLAGDEHTLGRITPQGAIAEFTLPSTIALGGITLGPDGSLWLVDTAANAIIRIKVARPV